MALSTARIIGRQLTVTCTGAKTIWDRLGLKFEFQTADASAADSTLDEAVFTRKLLTGNLSGFLGSVNNGGTLPAVGDTISDLAVAVSADTTIPSLAAYTNIKVLDASYDYEAGPAKWGFSFRSGLLN